MSKSKQGKKGKTPGKTRRDQIKVLIDCDAGVDDAEGIAVALTTPNVEVVGITCVNGNTNVENVCRNVLTLLTYYGKEREVPVFKGCTKPIINSEKKSDKLHGNDGFGDVDDLIKPDMSLLKPEHAVNAIVEIVNKHPGQISLITVGPLTNIAMAMRMDPELPEKLKDLTIMGGSLYGKGNFTLSSEFNFGMDPEAAHIVLNAITKPATLITFDLCMENPLSKDMSWYEKRQAIETKKAKFMTDITGFLVKALRKKFHCEEDCAYVSCDALAIVARLCDKVVKETKDFYAVIELNGKWTRGDMVIDWERSSKNKPNIRVVKKVNIEVVGRKMLESVE
ncbi:inosine-uridine preferring nucleoside hydrolase-like isoform X2 [Ptychodera flava]|uniref:inosine-uridine preferring nucleoside hydrolase-like isoform X2 n=1 Tax=Ptychodera flava TaxID=63121 RepID=UPI00396A5172